MELIYKFPDYCYQCPLMDLQMSDPDVVVTASGVPMIYCIHEAACATWNKILEENKGVKNEY